MADKRHEDFLKKYGSYVHEEKPEEELSDSEDPRDWLKNAERAIEEDRKNFIPRPTIRVETKESLERRQRNWLEAEEKRKIEKERLANRNIFQRFIEGLEKMIPNIFVFLVFSGFIALVYCGLKALFV